MKPAYYFKTFDELPNFGNGITNEVVEFLNISTGETFQHLHGTAYFDEGNKKWIFGVEDKMTHWRQYNLKERVESLTKFLL